MFYQSYYFIHIANKLRKQIPVFHLKHGQETCKGF